MSCVKESKAIGHEPRNIYFGVFIFIYFYAWPMATTKMSVWIAIFSKTYVYVGVLLSKKQLQLQITMGNNCHIIVLSPTYIHCIQKTHNLNTQPANLKCRSIPNFYRQNIACWNYTNLKFFRWKTRKTEHSVTRCLVFG